MNYMSNRELLMKCVEENALDLSKVDEILKAVEENDLSLDQFVVQRGYLSEKQFLQICSKELDLPFFEKLEASKIRIPEEYCEKVPIHFSRQYTLMAIGKTDASYQIATCTPLLMHPIDDLTNLLEGGFVDMVLAPRAEIVALINSSYKQNLDGAIGGEESETPESSNVEDKDKPIDDPNQPLIIRIVNNIILDAVRQRVSDIHLQPYEEKLQVRYRIDGILYDVQSVPKRYQDAVINRVKVMGKMDIAERRLPQDGRKSIKMGDAEVDIRISSVPTSHGERIVMRLLDKSARLYGLDEIGLDSKNLKIVEQFIHYNHGIMLVTGPTGSGKSTTLYAAITRLNSIEKNIITIEDPIEYNLHNISQIQVSEKKGLTFAKGLRTLLRQDPNIIMVGEIRDEETARISIQAALTGHMVFSTLHTNDSSSAITRLLDIGVEPFLVSSSLICVIAQRLGRKICAGCKTEYEPSPSKVQAIGLQPSDLGTKGVLFKGSGCEKCMRTGYKDRLGLYEILPITEKIREQIMSRASANVIKQDAIKRGLKTLRMDGAKKVLDGVTTIDEVLRVTQVDTL